MLLATDLPSLTECRERLPCRLTFSSVLQTNRRAYTVFALHQVRSAVLDSKKRKADTHTAVNLITPHALFSPILLQSCSQFYESKLDNPYIIRDLVQPEVDPFDPATPKTWNQT